MDLPFSVVQFYAVFSAYNTTLWPVQIVLLALAFVAIGLMVFPRRGSGVAVSAILSVLWAWLALAYHLAFFTAISPPAYAFAALSLAGAGVFFWRGVVRRKLRFRWVPGLRAVMGVCLVVFALAVYPAWTYLAGHRYPTFPTFGVPCPTAIFTLGLLAFLKAPYPRSPFVVPALWSFVGGQAAFLLNVPADYGLVVAGLMGTVLMLWPKVISPWSGKSA